MKTQLKIIATAIIMALATTTTPATASGHDKDDPKGVFLGGGAAFASLDCPSVSGFRCTSDSDTVPYIYLGWMANKHFGLELGYMHEAEFDVSVPSGSDSVATGTMDFSSLHFALIGRLPFNDNIAGFAKLGAASNNANLNVRNSSIAASAFSYDTGIMFGAGLEVSTGNLAGRLEYSQVDADLGYGGLSILYRFR